MKDNAVKLIQKAVNDIIRDYEDDVARAQEKRDARFRELDEIFESAKKEASTSITVSTLKATARMATKAEVIRVPKPGFTRVVRDIIEETNRKFDKNYIEKQIKKKHPDLYEQLSERTVPNILRRLRKKQNIIVVDQGIGKRPSKYKKSEFEQIGFPKTEGKEEE